MKDCLGLEAIARPERRTPAERAHVVACPRCRALAEQCAEFVTGRTDVTPADLGDAEARLAMFLDERFGELAAVATRPARRSPWSRFAAWCSAPAGRMALGFAALAIVAGGAFVLRAPRPAAPVVRGEAPVAMIVTARADAGAANVVLRWGAAPGADAYAIEILSADLVRLAMFGPVDVPSFTLSRGAVSGRPSGTTVYCRVVAKRAGVPVAESELTALPLP